MTRFVATPAVRQAVRGRETDVLDKLGIDWRAGRPHIDCPYPQHGGKSDWRWDEAKAKAFCTCVSRPDSIFDVAAKLKSIDFENKKVVTVIEVLSPSNKVLGSRGRASFESKRREVLDSSTHWVEIDLLRSGERVWTRRPLPPCEYLVHVSRMSKRPKGLIWPIRLPQRLPSIPIPLKPEDPDASLELQTVLDTAYDRAGYDLSVDYSRDPTPPLPKEWEAWADKWLEEKGVREKRS